MLASVCSVFADQKQSSPGAVKTQRYGIASGD